MFNGARRRSRLSYDGPPSPSDAAIPSNLRLSRVTAFTLLLLLPSLASAAEPIELRAGPLSMVFETDNAFLRYVRVGPHDVLQGINAPVRDQFWGTVQPHVTNVKLDKNSRDFKLDFDVTCRERDIDFAWHGQITGSAEGKLVFTFDGRARSTFLRNRIGFCVLHGPSAAGKPCVIETPEGEKIEGHFPQYISPHQPFKNIRSMAHEIAPDLWAHIRMDGDVFETEDQRNWTDASFKTYCTPLEIPYPVRVDKGTSIRHEIELHFEGDLSTLPSVDNEKRKPVILSLARNQSSRSVATLPRIGLQVSSQVDELSDKDLQRLRALQLSHLRVDIALSDAGFSEKLQRATSQAKSLGVTLHVGLHIGEEPDQELSALVTLLQAVRPPVSFWLVVSPEKRLLEKAKQHLSRYDSAAKIGVGPDTNFTELNRARPDPSSVNAVSYAINPQVHAFDNLSMVETLAIQGDTVRSARRFIGDLPVLISPITLRIQNVNQKPLPGELPSNVDARQETLFCAAWTLGSIKYLAEAGVHGLTYYETVGWKGVMAAESDSPLPEQFSAEPDTVFPVYHVLRSLAGFAGTNVLEVDSSAPHSVVGLLLKKPGTIQMLVANLTPGAQSIEIQGLDAGDARVLRLDDRSVRSANAAPEVFHQQAGEGVKLDVGTLQLKMAEYEVIRINYSTR